MNVMLKPAIHRQPDLENLRPDIFLGAAVFITALAIYSFFNSGHVQTIDVMQSIDVSQQIVNHGVVWITGIPPTPGGGSVPGVGGHLYAAHDIGLSLIFLPISLLDRWGIVSSTVSAFLYTLVDPLFGAIMVTLFFYFSYFLTRKKAPALVATAIIGLTTMLFVYARISFDAMPTATFLLLCYLLLTRTIERPRWTMTAGAGCAAAAACLVRIDSTILVTAASLWLLLSSRKLGPRKMIFTAIAGGLPLLGAAGVTAWYDTVRFGSWLNNGHAHDPAIKGTTALWYGLAGNLISPGKGLIIYAPPLLIAFVGWRYLMREHTGLTLTVLGGFSVYLIFVSRLTNWSGAEAWGPRFLVPSLPLLLLPLGSMLARWPTLNKLSRLSIGSLVIAGLLVQLPGVTTDDVALDHLDGGRLQATAFHNSAIGFGWQAVWRGITNGHPYPSTLAGGVIPPPVPRLDLWWLGGYPPSFAHPSIAFSLAAAMALVAAIGTATVILLARRHQ